MLYILYYLFRQVFAVSLKGKGYRTSSSKVLLSVSFQMHIRLQDITTMVPLPALFVITYAFTLESGVFS